MPEEPSSTDPGSTHRLLRASQDGDRAALAELLQRYLPVVRGFVRRRMSPLLHARESESDVLQSVCADLLAASEIGFTDESGFRKWLCTAALNKLRHHDRHFRAQKRDAAREQPFPSDGDVAAAATASRSPSGEVAARERRARLEEAMGKLPEHYREIVRLVRMEGLSYRDAAHATGRSEDSVRNVLARALMRLAAVLDPDPGQPGADS